MHIRFECTTFEYQTTTKQLFKTSTIMATRSRIAATQKDGKVISIYCHNAGYLEDNGAILISFYTDLNKINQLLKLGSLSSLGQHVAPPAGSNHTFNSPIKNTVVAYIRDRNEPQHQNNSETFESLADYIAQEPWEQFNYLFHENKWFVSVDDEGEFYELTLNMINTDELDRDAPKLVIKSLTDLDKAKAGQAKEDAKNIIIKRLMNLDLNSLSLEDAKIELYCLQKIYKDVIK